MKKACLENAQVQTHAVPPNDDTRDYFVRLILSRCTLIVYVYIMHLCINIYNVYVCMYECVRVKRIAVSFPSIDGESHVVPLCNQGR